MVSKLTASERRQRTIVRARRAERDKAIAEAYALGEHSHSIAQRTGLSRGYVIDIFRGECMTRFRGVGLPGERTAVLRARLRRAIETGEVGNLGGERVRGIYRRQHRPPEGVPR